MKTGNRLNGKLERDRTFSFKSGGIIKIAGFMLLLLLIADLLFSLSAKDGTYLKQLFSAAQKTFDTALTLPGEQKRITMLKAASQFKQLSDTYGIENGYLYYNIGNAFYEAGEIGKAILYYRKAERLLPGYLDLKTNLDQALSVNKAFQPQENWWDSIVKSLFFWHFMMDYATKRLLFILAFVLFWIVMTIALFRKHIFIRTGLIILILLNCLIGGSFIITSYQLNFAKSGVLTSKDVIARKGPGLNYNPVYNKPLPDGIEFKLLDKVGDWWHVELSNGAEIWVNKAEADLI